MDFFQSIPGGVVLTLAGLVVYGALLAWVRRAGHADRLPALVAATGMGLVVAAANLLAQALGWWGGHWSYALPIPLQVSFWVLWITPVMTVLLAGYRWLLRHVRRPRLAYGLLGLLVFAPGLVFIDNWALSTGRLSMGSGSAAGARSGRRARPSDRQIGLFHCRPSGALAGTSIPARLPGAWRAAWTRSVTWSLLRDGRQLAFPSTKIRVAA
jgi:hypothetical protein